MTDIELELKNERDQVQELKEKLVTQSTQLQERTTFIENMKKENQKSSINTEAINDKFGEKLDTLKKQIELYPKNLINLNEFQELIENVKSLVSTIQNENQKLQHDKNNFLNEIKSEFLKIKESQLIPQTPSPVVSTLPPKPIRPTKIIRGRESIGKITYEDRRTPTPPIVYRTERVVVRLHFFNEIRLFLIKSRLNPNIIGW